MSKEHVKAAVRNQKQGMGAFWPSCTVGGRMLTPRTRSHRAYLAHAVVIADDVAAGRATAGQMAKEHGKEAAADMGQWGRELKQVVKSDMLPGEAKVRDLPPMRGGEVADEVEAVPTRQGEAGRLASDKPGVRAM